MAIFCKYVVLSVGAKMSMNCMGNTTEIPKNSSKFSKNIILNFFVQNFKKCKKLTILESHQSFNYYVGLKAESSNHYRSSKKKFVIKISMEE